MSHLFNQHPDERLRDAMLAYYLAHKVPASLKDKLSNADDLYEYWLLDVQVSRAVPTSPVACAIASLQQYITRIQLGLEAGYENQGMSAQHDRLWREQLHTYPVWSASQQLRYHPANYLDPTLRRNKTDSFQQLENELSQYRVQSDSVVTAVQSYLARFEEIANIRTLNGYIDGNTTALYRSTYYFVGKSSSENTYYWRSLDLSRRSGERLFPDAWSAWKKINLTPSEDTIEASIRPVFFNNRLFLVWAECSKPAPTSAFKTTPAKPDTKQRLNEWADSHFPKFRLNFSYKKHNDSWSAAQTCIEEYCAAQEINGVDLAAIKSLTHTVAIVDAASSNTPARLFLGLHTTDPKQQEPFSGKFFQAVEVDPHFNMIKIADGGTPGRYKVPQGSELSEEIHELLKYFQPSQQQQVKQALAGNDPEHEEYYNELLLGTSRQHFTLFGHTNQGNLQFKFAPSTKHSITQATLEPNYTNWDYLGNKTSIEEAKYNSSSFDPDTQELVFTSTLKGTFQHPYTVTIKKGDYTLTLTTETLGDATTPQLKLSAGSRFTDAYSNYKAGFYAIFLRDGVTHEEFINCIHDDESRLIKPTPDGEEAISLEGKFIDRSAFIHLYQNTHHTFDVLTNRLTTSTLPSGLVALHGTNALSLIRCDAKIEKYRVYKHVVMRSNFAEYPLVEQINEGSARILNLQDTAHTSLVGSSPELSIGHKVTARIPMTAEMLKAGVTLIHGVLTLEINENRTQTLGCALKAVELKSTAVSTISAALQQLAPRINTYTSLPLGTAQFIDFSGSTPNAASDTPKTLRMNTCVADKLVKAANTGLEQVFSLTPQHWQEPPLAEKQVAEAIDFQGAYGQYFWELFLYLPWLVAHRLDQEQQHEEAQAWLTYIFDPARAADAAIGRPAYWGFNELARREAVPGAISHDPHELAIRTPLYFRKAVYLFFLDILINRGDAAYRQLTPDSLTQAKLWYTRVNRLLGARPTITTTEPWASITLRTLVTTPSQALRELEWSTPSIDMDRPVDDAARALPAPTDKLCLPFNTDLVARWDKLESRLHNLRHNLDITGKPLQLALYGAPLAAPTLLASQVKDGLVPAVGAAAFPSAQVGHYRFQIMLGHALAATDAVIQFGNTLLTLNERKDQAEYLELQHQQAWDLANIVVMQHTQALLIDEKNRQALSISRQIIEARLGYYQHLLTEGVSHHETKAGQLYLASNVFDAAGAVAGAGAGIAMMAPNIVGTSVGGSRWEGPFHAAQALAQGAATALRSTASDLDRTEQFKRRAQEWAHAQEQARFELAQVDAQLQAYAEQEKATRLQLRLAQTTLAQAWSSYQLLIKRFANAQLYDWLNAQLGQFFYQAYDLSLGLCRAAEASWQYEMADNRSFIQTGAWNTRYRGYLAGEALKLSLLKMNDAYLQTNVRDLEIVKTLSLRHRVLDCNVQPLVPTNTSELSETAQADTPARWAHLKKQLVSDGALCFKLPQTLFEEDYPNHILRRIKGISVSLPATLGAYEDIKAILTQTSHEIELPNGTSIKDKRAHQQIALSTGLDDNGLFALTFDSHERYLPFEYTGAISEWTLTFPNHDMQKAILESINDIVIHLRYTARVKPTAGAQV